MSSHNFQFMGPPGISAKPLVDFQLKNKTWWQASQQRFDGIYGVKHCMPSDLVGHCLISNVGDSILENVSTLRLTSINLFQVNKSFLRLSCKGSIYMHEIRDLVMIVSCHQLRLCRVINLLILINDTIGNRISIEECEGLRVGYDASQEIPHVDDFNWPTTALENPHCVFCVIPVNTHDWTNDVPGGTLSSVWRSQLSKCTEGCLHYDT